MERTNEKSLYPRYDELIYVVLRQKVAYGELVCTTECSALQMRCRTKRGRYNRVQLYFVFNNFPFTFKVALCYPVSNDLNKRQLHHAKCKICLHKYTILANTMQLSGLI